MDSELERIVNFFSDFTPKSVIKGIQKDPIDFKSWHYLAVEMALYPDVPKEISDLVDKRFYAIVRGKIGSVVE